MDGALTAASHTWFARKFARFTRQYPPASQDEDGANCSQMDFSQACGSRRRAATRSIRTTTARSASPSFSSPCRRRAGTFCKPCFYPAVKATGSKHSGSNSSNRRGGTAAACPSCRRRARPPIAACNPPIEMDLWSRLQEEASCILQAPARARGEEESTSEWRQQQLMAGAAGGGGGGGGPWRRRLTRG